MSDPAAESRIFWQYHVEAFSRSGLSIVDYCRQHALVHSTFQRWRKLLATSAAQPAVVPVKLEAMPILPLPVSPIMLESGNWQLAPELATRHLPDLAGRTAAEPGVIRPEQV